MVRKLLICMMALLMGVAMCYGQDIKSLKKAAKKGDHKAQLELGVAYMKGTGVNVDYKKAYKLFSQAKSAERRASYYVAQLVESGKIAAKNGETARYWYELGASEGDVDCQVWMGQYKLTQSGDSLGIGKSIWDRKYIKEAKDYFKKAADQGNAEAQWHYARIVFNQNLIERQIRDYEGVDDDTWNHTKEYFGLAAKQGHRQAQKQYDYMLAYDKRVADAKQHRRDSIDAADRYDSLCVAQGKIPKRYFELIKGCEVYGIQDKYVEHDKLRELEKLCGNDMLDYYGKAYLSDLKMAVYKQSDEYQENLAEFNRKRNVKVAFFIAPSTYIHSKGINLYNLNIVKSYLRISSDLYFPIKGLLDNRIKIAIPDLNILQRLDAEKSHIKILMFFQPMSAYAYTEYSYNSDDENTRYITAVKPFGMYLVNSQTGEIYYNLSDYMRETDHQREQALATKKNEEAKAKHKRHMAEQKQKYKTKYHKQAKRIICLYCSGQGIMRAGGNYARCMNCYGAGYTTTHYY